MTLDEICAMTKKAHVLNALHACRLGHPLGKDVRNPWFEAWFLCCQQPSYEISGLALQWLREQGNKHDISGSLRLQGE